MQKHVCILMILIAGMAGCSTPGTRVDIIDETFQREQDEINGMLNDIFNTAKARDMDSLDSYHLKGPKFSKFDDGEIPGRQDYEMGKETENAFFTGVSEFDFTLPDTKVDVFDDAAIATFIIDYQVKVNDSTIRGKSRGTLVFVKDNDRWKIAHEHFSGFIQP